MTDAQTPPAAAPLAERHDERDTMFACMARYPFSQRDNWFHNLVRWTIERWPGVRRPALWFDDRVYGRGWKIR